MPGGLIQKENVLLAKKLIYTDHARERMLERGITESDVEYCIKNPEIVLHPKCGDRFISHVNGKRVEVRTDRKKPFLIVTVID